MGRLTLTIVLLPALLFFPAAFGDSGHLIGIQLSQACVKMETNHVKSNCLSYDTLKQFDRTNSLLAGPWVNDTWYHRAAPHNTYQLYNLDPWVVFVDPSSDYTTHSKMIIVQSSNFTFINPAEIVGANHTRTEYHNRFVSSCNEALVAPNLFLINDTINYLKSGCKTTNYNDTVKVSTPAFQWSYDNPYSTLHYYNYLKSIYHKAINTFNQTGGKGLEDCIHHKCNYKDPFSNW